MNSTAGPANCGRLLSRQPTSTQEHIPLPEAALNISTIGMVDLGDEDDDSMPPLLDINKAPTRAQKSSRLSAMLPSSGTRGFSRLVRQHTATNINDESGADEFEALLLKLGPITLRQDDTSIISGSKFGRYASNTADGEQELLKPIPRTRSLLTRRHVATYDEDDELDEEGTNQPWDEVFNYATAMSARVRRTTGLTTHAGSSDFDGDELDSEFDEDLEMDADASATTTTTLENYGSTTRSKLLRKAKSDNHASTGAQNIGDDDADENNGSPSARRRAGFNGGRSRLTRKANSCQEPSMGAGLDEEYDADIEQIENNTPHSSTNSTHSTNNNNSNIFTSKENIGPKFSYSSGKVTKGSSMTSLTNVTCPMSPVGDGCPLSPVSRASLVLSPVSDSRRNSIVGSPLGDLSSYSLSPGEHRRHSIVSY